MKQTASRKLAQFDGGMWRIVEPTGDVVLIDGTILSDDQPIAGKINKMIVGRCPGKINKTTIAVLRD